MTPDELRQAIAADARLAKCVAHIQISARRKTLGLAMSPGDDGITIQVPATAAPGEVLRLLSKNRDRIGAMILKAKQYAPDNPVKELVNGSGFLWLGRSSRLRLVDNATETVRRVNDQGTPSDVGRWLELDRAHLRHGAKPLIDWYIREGSARLQEEAVHLWSRMAPRRSIPTVRAGDIGRTRWSKHDGRPGRDEVTIAWQTFQLTPTLIRHVLAHELTHTTRPGGTAHGPEFWRTLERAEIDARQTERRLNEEGRHIWMGDVRQAPE